MEYSKGSILLVFHSQRVSLGQSYVAESVCVPVSPDVTRGHHCVLFREGLRRIIV